jgi:hypothetical protein
MQQIIVMYQCKNSKSNGFREFGYKNHVKWSSGSKDMGFGSLSGQDGIFTRFWGTSRIFGVVGGSLRKRQGLLQIFGIF